MLPYNTPVARIQPTRHPTYSTTIALALVGRPPSLRRKEKLRNSVIKLSYPIEGIRAIRRACSFRVHVLLSGTFFCLFCFIFRNLCDLDGGSEVRSSMQRHAV